MGDTLFGAVIEIGNQTRFHLIVEQLPDGSGWDWTVWRPGDAPQTARHGIAASATAAMRAAEAAARDWNNSAPPC